MNTWMDQVTYLNFYRVGIHDSVNKLYLTMGMKVIEYRPNISENVGS
jgi:hypothetical protein